VKVPVDDEQWTDSKNEAKLFLDLPLAALAWRLSWLDISAWQVPPFLVGGFDE